MEGRGDGMMKAGPEMGSPGILPGPEEKKRPCEFKEITTWKAPAGARDALKEGRPIARHQAGCIPAAREWHAPREGGRAETEMQGATDPLRYSLSGQNSDWTSDEVLWRRLCREQSIPSVLCARWNAAGSPEGMLTHDSKMSRARHATNCQLAFSKTGPAWSSRRGATQ